MIAGSRLPKLRELAPEVYQTPMLRHHSSWVAVLLNYVQRADIGPLSRVKRKTMSEGELADIRTDGVKGTEVCK